MSRSLYALAISTIALATVACAGSARGQVRAVDIDDDLPVGTAIAVRYKLDAFRVHDGANHPLTAASWITYQGALEVRGDRARLALDIDRDERSFDGAIERGDVTKLWLFEHGEPVCELDCVTDPEGMSCRPRQSMRAFGVADMPALRFERLALRVTRY